MIGIINASPLIFLGKIGALNFLPQLFIEILTTNLVRNEVLQKENTPERIILENAFSSWIKTRNFADSDMFQKLQELNIHQGEASILCLTDEILKEGKKSVAIIDDLAVRDVAQTMRIPIIGTLGILLRSVDVELISSKQCKVFLMQLIETPEFYISTRIYTRLINILEEYEE